jgi:hypothetical protein
MKAYRYSFTLKLFILFLCFNVLLIGANHVFCMEFSDSSSIKTVHLQCYECNSLVKVRPETKHSHLEQITSIIMFGNLEELNSNCHDCMDEHIQFQNKISRIDVPPAYLATYPIATLLDKQFQNLLTSRISSLCRFQHTPITWHKLSPIRTTVLLI